MIAEKRLSVVEVAEQLGDRTSTVLDTYAHVISEWRGAGPVDIEGEIRIAADRVSKDPLALAKRE